MITLPHIPARYLSVLGIPTVSPGALADDLLPPVREAQSNLTLYDEDTAISSRLGFVHVGLVPTLVVRSLWVSVCPSIQVVESAFYTRDSPSVKDCDVGDFRPFKAINRVYSGGGLISTLSGITQF